MKCPNCGDENSIPLPLGFQCRKCGVTFGRHIKDKEVKGDEIEYLQFFRSATLSAVAQDIRHPVDLVIALFHTRTARSEFGERLPYCLARFLCDNFEAEYGGRPQSAMEVLEWCDAHFPVDHPMVGSLRFLEGNINGHLRGT